jgi:hypothetical protein
VQRNSFIAEIFGYIVCLMTVAIFFMSVAGVVNGAFRIANPTAPARMLVHAMGHQRGPMMAPGTMPGPGAMPGPPSADITAARADMTANARYNAVRRFVLALVMLAASILVFRRTFEWLNPRASTP